MSLLNTRGVARRLAISCDEVRRLYHEKHLPAVCLPGRRSFLFREEDVDALVERSVDGEISGTVSGTIPEKQPPQLAPNKRCQAQQKIVNLGDKYQWMERFTRK
jgi:excisionase family DNA binding protein